MVLLADGPHPYLVSYYVPLAKADAGLSAFQATGRHEVRLNALQYLLNLDFTILVSTLFMSNNVLIQLRKLRCKCPYLMS